jgi:hypothetical protein
VCDLHSPVGHDYWLCGSVYVRILHVIVGPTYGGGITYDFDFVLLSRVIEFVLYDENPKSDLNSLYLAIEVFSYHSLLRALPQAAWT